MLLVNAPGNGWLPTRQFLRSDLRSDVPTPESRWRDLAKYDFANEQAPTSASFPALRHCYRQEDWACVVYIALSSAPVKPYRAYFTSTVAPASSSCFLIFAASSLLTPSFTGFGAPSTRSLASLRPRLVIARTSLITLIFFSPALVRTTVNSVFSAAAAAPGAPPAAPATAATATGAAAETPHFSSSFLASSAASRTESFESSSTIVSRLAMGPYSSGERVDGWVYGIQAALPLLAYAATTRAS